MGQSTELYLTTIVLYEDIIIEAIHELSPSSAAGPDGIPSSLLVNGSTKLALLLFINEITHSLFSVLYPLVLNVLQLLLYLNQVTGQS